MSKYVYQNKGCLKTKRRNLRNNQTWAEKLLWKHLKGSYLGIRFRRQYSIDSCIVDFYCPKYKLIIEVDGNIHDIEEVRIKDYKRQKYLENKGYTILRFENDKIVTDTESVLSIIIETIYKLSDGKETLINF